MKNERSKRLPSRQENKKLRIARQFAFSVAATSHIIYMKEAAARVREKTANLLSRSRATFVLRWLAGQVAAAASAARSARFEDGEHAVRSGPILSPGNCHTHPISWGFRLQASDFPSLGHPNRAPLLPCSPAPPAPPSSLPFLLVDDDVSGST